MIYECVTYIYCLKVLASHMSLIYSFSWMGDGEHNFPNTPSIPKFDFCFSPRVEGPVQDPLLTRSVFPRKLATRLVGHGAVVPAMLFSDAFRTSPGATSAA